MTVPASFRNPGRFSLADRRILFLMAVAAFVTGYCGGLMTHTLPFARESLGLSEGSMSWIFATTRAVSLVAIIFSVLGDRTGRRAPFLIAFAAVPAANLLTGLFPGVVAYTAFQSIGRAAVVAVAALSIVLLAEELTPGIRAYGIGIYGLAGSLGTGTGLVFLPVAESGDDSWRILFVAAGLGLLAVPLLVRFLKESRMFVIPTGPISFRAALSAGLGRYFWPLAGIAFFIAAFSSPAFDFALERLIDDLEWSASAARFLLILFSGAGTVGLLAGGRLADTAGRRPTTVIAILFGLVGGLAFYTFGTGWILAPSIFLSTFGATMLTPAFAAHRSELFPTRVHARAGAWVTNAAIAGSISGFVAGGLLIDRIGLSTTVTMLGLGLVVAVFLTLQLPETRARDLSIGAPRADTPRREPARMRRTTGDAPRR